MGHQKSEWVTCIISIFIISEAPTLLGLSPKSINEMYGTFY